MNPTGALLSREASSGPSRLSGILVASALALLAGWNTGDVGPVADPLAAAYRVGLPSIGLLITALLVVHSLAQVPSGGWTDRLGAKRAGLLAVAVLVAGNLILSATLNFPLAVVTRFFMGGGTALAFLAGNGFLRLAGDSPLAQGWLGGMGIGGGGLAIAIVPRLDAVLSWRAPYLAALAMAAVTLTALALAPPTEAASS
ncbi:MAG TPA: MFS transporter, partial [Chloroflexota bacterium]|nr:MFS transporter [Chloroflexota bacterium]